MAKNTVASYLSLDLPKTRIMATIGPSNYEMDHLRGMIQYGATIFRFNAAKMENGVFKKEYIKGKKVKVSSVLDDIKLLSEEQRQPITTSIDLAGPKVRMKQIISIHKREKETEREKENHPEEGDIVYLYCKNVNWSDNHIKETLGSIGPSTIKSIDPDGQKDKEANNEPAHIDNIWRLQTDIKSFETVIDYISIGDGLCNLSIQECSPKNDFVKVRVDEVANKFCFFVGQGVNPKGYVFPQILQKKDFKDFTWALKNDFDVVCVSFVCSPFDFFELKKEMNHVKKKQEKGDWKPLIFAKIETIFAVNPKAAQNFCKEKKLDKEEFYKENVPEEDHERYIKLIELYKKNPIKAICETFDGAMVARGDLAAEADKYSVPFYQKEIVNACHLSNKPVIIATEVLKSMKDGNPSTRAEIGDIATAILDGADAIMLADEVASSEKSDPAKVVRELKTAIRTAEINEEKEKWLRSAGDIKYFYEKFSRLLHEGETHLKEMKEFKLLPPGKEIESEHWKIGMGSRVCLAARSKDAPAILVSVTTGATAKYISYFRPAQPIISIGNNMKTARRLLLWKGIYPVVMQYPSKYELNDFILIANEIHSTIRIEPTPGTKDKKEFVIPGLLRIKSKLQDEKEEKRLPSTVHEISLLMPPKGVPEREKKYVLNKEGYDKIKEHLEKDYKVKDVKQRNYYFYDESGIIEDKKAMVRIRIEEIDRKPERAVLTFKKKGKKVGGGTEERPEKEFDVTRYLLINGLFSNSNGFFNKLPEFFKKLLWKEFKEDFLEKGLDAPDKISLKNIAMMTNKRLTVETHSDLTLELDAFTTKENHNYYELEIETIAADEAKRDEYVRLLFKSLGIKEICEPDYPQKFVRTLLDFGIMEMTEKYRNAIDKVNSELGITHIP